MQIALKFNQNLITFPL